MQERAHLVGGEFEIRSDPGQGVQIDVCVPYQPASGAAPGHYGAAAVDKIRETAIERIKVLIVDDQEMEVPYRSPCLL